MGRNVELMTARFFTSGAAFTSTFSSGSCKIMRLRFKRLPNRSDLPGVSETTEGSETRRRPEATRRRGRVAGHLQPCVTPESMVPIRAHTAETSAARGSATGPVSAPDRAPPGPGCRRAIRDLRSHRRCRARNRARHRVVWTARPADQYPRPAGRISHPTWMSDSSPLLMEILAGDQTRRSPNQGRARQLRDARRGGITTG